MAHQIEKPWDRVFSVISTEWHGLAEKVEKIVRETLAPIFFSIVEGQINITLGNESVKLEDKAIVADYRFRDDIPEGQRIKALSVMGKDYRVITNEEIFNAADSAIVDHGLDAEIVTAGTLKAGKVFFMSLAQSKNTVEIVKGDKWDFYLNLTASHDGTIAVTPHISTTRQVCMNTVRASLDSAEISAVIYHTKNAGLQMQSLPELLVAMRNKQAEMVEAIAYLAGIPCTSAKAEKLLAGYYVGVQSTPDAVNRVLSTRTSNSIAEIVGLFNNGTGNNGTSMYDLLNGVTEYYTGGNGTGRNSDALAKLYKANMGGAADHKTAFMGAITSPEGRDRLIALGSDAELLA
jgi:hypothetical protein